MDGTSIYKTVFGQRTPYVWQRKFATDEWPDVLIAPTGSGKTAGVTLGWVASRMRDPENTPRRLVWCLPMRTLVEQTADAVKEWFGNLAAEVNGTNVLPGPKDVHVLMGGVEAARWLEDPERPAVIVGTQDMLLSRALMRGYASSRAIWPMEFALLHEDAQWVFDEVQLMGAGRATSAQLEAFRRVESARAALAGRPKGCPSRSLWISATLDPEWLETVDHATPTSVMRVDPYNEEDARLARLASARKVLNRAAATPVSSKAVDESGYLDQLADSICNAHRTGCMTLAIVNRVARARALHAKLRKKLAGHGAAPTLALVHSRFRPEDRKREMAKVFKGKNNEPDNLIVVATQAIEAGIDISAAVMFTEIAPWPSMVQRFGRANRYAEIDDGADIHWIDLIGESEEDDKDAVQLALPYTVAELKAARELLSELQDVAPKHLRAPGEVDPPRRVIRRKDLDDLFDTDSDLTGFDVDISPYVRDADDTDVRVFWRDLSVIDDDPPRPRAEELCAVPIGAAKDWLSKRRKLKTPGALVLIRDPQWRRGDGKSETAPAGWVPFREDPWPGLTLLVDLKMGGYNEASGFTGNPKDIPEPIRTPQNVDSQISGEAEGHDDDPRSEIGIPVKLSAHLGHVATEADALCNALKVSSETREAIIRAARWHDLGKAHEVFQRTMRKGLDSHDVAANVLLAKTVKKNLRHDRAYFRHELASMLAFLDHEGWSRNADLAAYLIAAHHGKVRMNLRALPREAAPKGEHSGKRFARGIWENDDLQAVTLGDNEYWEGGRLTLSVMELGWDEISRESWTQRTRELLAQFGPFRLAWMETLVRVADWRASAKEQERLYDDV